MKGIEDKTGFEHKAITTEDQEREIGESPVSEEINQLNDQPEPPPDEVKPLPPAVPLPDPKSVSFASPKKTTKPDKPTAQEKKPTRQIMSVAVTQEEYEYLQKVFEARKASGLSNNLNHFLKQCLNYAVNWQKGWQFGVPANIDKVYLDK